MTKLWWTGVAFIALGIIFPIAFIILQFTDGWPNLGPAIARLVIGTIAAFSIGAKILSYDRSR